MKIWKKNLFLPLAKTILDPDLHQLEKWDPDPDPHQNVLDPPHWFQSKKGVEITLQGSV